MPPHGHVHGRLSHVTSDRKHTAPMESTQKHPLAPELTDVVQVCLELILLESATVILVPLVEETLSNAGNLSHGC